MSRRGTSAIIYSAAGVAAMFALLVGLNVLLSHHKLRLDLTQERAFTLSEGSRQILQGLASPVQVRLYVDPGEGKAGPGLQAYAREVQDLLEEMREVSSGKLEIQMLRPLPDSEAEDSARLDGVIPQTLPDGDRIYLGLAFSQLDRKAVLPFLAPSGERLLEYDIMRSIVSVTTGRKPVLGMLTPLQIGRSDPRLPLSQRPPEPSIFLAELQRAYDVRMLPYNEGTPIPEDIQTLVVLHPKGISPQTQYELDQFLLRGGRLLVFLDPMCVMDQLPPSPMMGPPPPSSSTLDKLLPAWGLDFPLKSIVVDMENLGTARQRRAPGILALGDKALNPDDILTTAADNLFMVLAGTFEGSGTTGIDRTVLVSSSEQSKLEDPGMTQMSPEEVERRFEASGKSYPLAVRLSGNFKTAFPDGKPARQDPGRQDGSPAAAGLQAGANPGLKTSRAPGTVVLVSDVDMLFDPVAVAEMPTPFGQPMRMPANGNLAFAQAAVEQLTGDTALMAVRSRASRARPFTVVRKMTAEAEARFRDKIAELERELSEAQERLAQLQQRKDPQQRFILTEEEAQEVERFRARETETKRALKELRRDLRREVDSLEQRTKWVNILAMPLAVALAGISVALLRSRRRGGRP